jgi:hypothetical protein
VVHPVWATSTREISRSFLYYYPANEGIQPTAKPAVTSSYSKEKIMEILIGYLIQDMSGGFEGIS